MNNIRSSERAKIEAFDKIGVDLRPRKGAAALQHDATFDEKFMTNFGALCQWRNRNGGFVGVPKGLKDFCTDVRERHASQRLSEDHINCLTSISFPWTEFDAGFKQLLAFKRKENHFNVPEDHACFLWTKEIRRLYKENDLRDMAYEMLLASGFPFEDPVLPSPPRRTNQSARVRFAAEGGSRVNRRGSQMDGQRSSISRQKKSRPESQMGRKDRSDNGGNGNGGNDNDDSDYDDSHCDHNSGYNNSIDDGNDDDGDGDDGDTSSDDDCDSDDGDNGNGDNGNDKDDDDDDDNNGFSDGTRPANQIRRRNMQTGPRNILDDDDDSGSCGYHSDGANIDNASGNKMENIDNVNEGEDVDLESPPFSSNDTLPDEGGGKSRTVEDNHDILENNGNDTDEEFQSKLSNDGGAVLPANDIGRKSKEAIHVSKLGTNDNNEEPKEEINMNRVKTMRKDDLVQRCKGHGLATNGTKSILTSRLYQFYSECPKYNLKK